LKSLSIRRSRFCHARPSVEHVNGNGAGDYKSIKLTSVGRHDTQPNNTVRVVGALQPDPRKHMNEFQAWDVAKTESEIDRFVLDDKNLINAEEVSAESKVKRSPQVARYI
jgi:hypothetical protein